eukprot:1669554-Pleurochrysis_carterae.AAC.1
MAVVRLCIFATISRSAIHPRESPSIRRMHSGHQKNKLHKRAAYKLDECAQNARACTRPPGYIQSFCRRGVPQFSEYRELKVIPHPPRGTAQIARPNGQAL